MLEQERAEIDQIDQQLMPLLAQRLQVGQRIAAVKHQHQLPLVDRRREAQVYEQIGQRVPAEQAEYVRTLYADILLVSKQYQARLIKAWQDEADGQSAPDADQSKLK
ncbi:chorismate mutase [Lapidilactobacillus achengensis]|uniref:Chorismate mutase n=1 Tax=Lapidilactobacillus achengensis TaxID=2486000 RepID=A0ABW1UR24_9LACO|nr:chorismate mutase [Lapidilactobacillus achengensis]